MSAIQRDREIALRIRSRLAQPWEAVEFFEERQPLYDALVDAALGMEKREEHSYTYGMRPIHGWPEYSALRTALAALESDDRTSAK